MHHCSSCHSGHGEKIQYRGYYYHPNCLISVLTRTIGEARAEQELAEIRKAVIQCSESGRTGKEGGESAKGTSDLRPMR